MYQELYRASVETFSTNVTSARRNSLLLMRLKASTNRNAPGTVKCCTTETDFESGTSLNIDLPKKVLTDTLSTSAIRVRRPAPTRLTPFSYFCTCWNETPIF